MDYFPDQSNSQHNFDRQGIFIKCPAFIDDGTGNGLECNDVICDENGCRLNDGSDGSPNYGADTGNEKTFLADLNMWNKQILENDINVDKQYLYMSAINEERYEIFKYPKNILNVLFHFTYQLDKMNMFYYLHDGIKDSRLRLYNDVYVYMPDKLANEDVELPVDSTSPIPISIIPNEESQPRQDGTTKPSYNALKLTWEEYFLIDIIRKYKSGLHITIEEIDRIESLQFATKLTTLLADYINCELFNVFPDLTKYSFNENDRLIEHLYFQWLLNYYFIKKGLCSIEYIEHEWTHYFIPRTESRILVLTDEIFNLGYITINTENLPISKEKIILIDKNNELIERFNYNNVSDSTSSYFNIILSDMKSNYNLNEKIYIIWAYI